MFLKQGNIVFKCNIFTIWNKACDASFLKHYQTPVIHYTVLHFKNEETLFYSAGPISRCSRTFGTSKLTHIISPFPSKRISTTTPKVKKSPWLSENSANTDVSIDSDRDNREKNTNVCVTSAEPEFTLKHEALKKILWEYSHLWRMLIIPIPCFNSYFHFHIQA